MHKRLPHASDERAAMTSKERPSSTDGTRSTLLFPFQTGGTQSSYAEEFDGKMMLQGGSILGKAEHVARSGNSSRPVCCSFPPCPAKEAALALALALLFFSSLELKCRPAGHQKQLKQQQQTNSSSRPTAQILQLCTQPNQPHTSKAAALPPDISLSVHPIACTSPLGLPQFVCVFPCAGLRTWFERTRDRGKKSFKDRSLFDWAAAVLPCLGWLRTYKIKEYLIVSHVEEGGGALGHTASAWVL